MRARHPLLFISLLLTISACQSAGSDQQMRERISAQQATADRHRFDRPRDAGRKPFATFEVLGIRSGMTVLDVGAYAGYTTEMLSAAVGPEGRVYSHNTEQVLRRYAKGYYQRTMVERLANNRLPNVILHLRDYTALGLEGQIDAAFLGNLLHDFYRRDGREGTLEILRAIGRTLKPTGVLGLTDHVGTAQGNNQALHRIRPELALALLQDAGFELVRESPLFANPDDDHTLMVYDEAIYRRTDRFFYVLRFNPAP